MDSSPVAWRSRPNTALAISLRPADQARKSDDFAGLHVKRNRSGIVPAKKDLRTEGAFFRHLFQMLREIRLDAAPDHHAHNRIRRGIGTVERSHAFPVPQHGDAIAQPENLGHAM